MAVVTPRLELVSLPLPLVTALVAHDLPTARALAPFPIDERTFAGDEHVLGLRRDQLVIDPDEEPWLFRAAVHRETGVVIGKVGFHTRPDADGVVEIGYRVAPAHQRQGFAREMAVGLIRWGAERGARTCLASVRPDNEPSLRIVDRLGFVRIGEQLDDIDGLEWVFSLPLTGSALPSHDGR